MNNGHFVISLDFELFWGVRDKRTIEEYGENVKVVHDILPKMLQLFGKYKMPVTFSTVGFLFFKNKEELLQGLATELPTYHNELLSPYAQNYLDQLGANEIDDPYHYAWPLIKLIAQDSLHEIGTHTFSHYYCLEPGQTVSQFQADIKAAIAIANTRGININSLVFPRNQFNNEYLKVCAENGIISYRGNERSWLYEAKDGASESTFRRAFRLMDAYFNISGHHTYSHADLTSYNGVYDIAASRFLRPFSASLKFLEPLKLKRIFNSMTDAAKHGRMYHLWWHPHNFGSNARVNLEQLEKILQHYQQLQSQFSFEGITMTNMARLLKQNHED